MSHKYLLGRHSIDHYDCFIKAGYVVSIDKTLIFITIISEENSIYLFSIN